MKLKIALIFLASLVTKGYAQTLFEDGSGEALLLRNGIYKPWFNFRINTSNESFTMSYNRVKDLTDTLADQNRAKSNLFGVDLKVKMTDGFGTFVKKGKVNTGITLSASLGRQTEKYGVAGTPTNPSTSYFSGGISYDKHTMLDTLAFVSNDLKKVSAFIDYHWNKLWVGTNGNGKASYQLFGISLGYKGTNNLDDLDDGVGSSITKSNGAFSIAKNEDGKIGDYKRYDSFPIRADYGIIPRIFDDNIVGFNFFGRMKLNVPDNPINLGGGIFFTKKGEPTNVIGGVGWQFNDVINKTDRVKNSSIFVYVGYTID